MVQLTFTNDGKGWQQQQMVDGMPVGAPITVESVDQWQSVFPVIEGEVVDLAKEGSFTITLHHEEWMS